MHTKLSDNSIVQKIVSDLLDGKTALSYSSLSAFKRSPKEFVEYKLKTREVTPAMIYGSMVHCLVLEPEDFFNRYHPLDDTDICMQIGGAKPRATKAYREWKEVAIQEASGKEIVETDDYRHAKMVAENVVFNDASRKVLNLCPEHETPIEWDFLNFKWRGFRDGTGKKAMSDLKTCPDADPKQFRRHIYEMGYHIQAAMYLHGSGMDVPYYIIAVDKKGGVSVHLLDERLIEAGMNEYTRLVNAFNECILSDGFYKSYDFWSNRYDGVFLTEKPSYMY
jgi:hypothetical protein